MHRNLIPLGWVTAITALSSSCGSPPPAAPASNAPPTAPAARADQPASAPRAAETAGQSTPAATATAEATASPSDDESAKPDPSHCPENMLLVEGDYCSDVRHTCSEQWYSKANKKEVCEKFEPQASCVGEKTPKRFCIDKYSWPNREGERPEVMNNFYQAQVKCAAVGKRLCTESEWTMSCEGPRLLPFPYGFERDPNKCNGDRDWDHPDMNKVARRDPAELARLWQGVRSGQQPECVSEYGVHDLPGNNDEVVASETYAAGFRGKYDSVHTGGPWYRGVRNQCRPKIYTHDEGFYYYFLGFRCCAEPDGAPSDPRTPKQIRRDWDFSRIERLARFDTEEMRKKLDEKARGACECSAQDTLCKTMCGTLLGPEAKDVQLKPTQGK